MLKKASVGLKDVKGMFLSEKGDTFFRENIKKESHHHFTNYISSQTRENYFLVRLQDALIKLHYKTNVYGKIGYKFDKWLRVEVQHVDELLDMKEANELDIRLLREIIEEDTCNLFPVPLDEDGFIREFSETGNYAFTERNLITFYDELASSNECDGMIINIGFPDQHVLGYLLINLKGTPYLIPYRIFQGYAENEVLDVSNMKPVREKEKAYLKEYIAYLEKGNDILDFATKTQRIRTLFTNKE